jgi:hypothetical protein
MPAPLAAWFGTLEAGSKPSASSGTSVLAPTAPAASTSSPFQQQQHQTQQPLQRPIFDEGTSPTLIHQRLSVYRQRYAAPRELQPQAGQLIGLIFSLVGPPAISPTVPGLRHPNTQAKYELLRLLWRRAERAAAAWEAADSSNGAAGDALERAVRAERAEREAREDAAKEAELAANMTYHLRVSLAKVMADDRVPQKARDIAAARLREREGHVTTGLAAYLAAVPARADFPGVIFPLLRHVLGPLEASGGYESQADSRGSPLSAANGDRMEARALALVAAQLPPGWSVLPNAHVVALDGRHPNHHAACKWEVDFVVLDERGTAVAMFEVGGEGVWGCLGWVFVVFCFT